MPEKRRVSPPAEIIGPCLERMRFLEEETLWKMFENLVARSMDKHEVDVVHPAFPTILSQLAAEEALLLQYLSKAENVVTWEFLYHRGRAEVRGFAVEGVDEAEPLPLHDGNKVQLYASHLVSLSLCEPPYLGGGNIADKPGQPSEISIRMTDFGRLFMKACAAPEAKDGTTGGDAASSGEGEEPKGER